MKAINNKLLAAMGLATALSFSGQASAMVIDGVTLGAGGPVFKVASTYETIVTGAGDILSGYGEVTQVFDSNGLVWSAGQNDTILTYVFDGFIATAGFTPTHADFTSGTVKFYTDHPSIAGYTAFTPIGPGGSIEVANDFIEASTGNGGLWLSLVGNEFFTGDPLHAGGVTLHSTGLNLGGPVLISGTGTGLLDIIGGAAASAFVKDTIGDADADGKADAQIGSSFSDAFTPANQPLSGSADLRAEVIPEPSSLALLGLGLSAIGFFASRRRKA